MEYPDAYSASQQGVVTPLVEYWTGSARIHLSVMLAASLLLLMASIVSSGHLLMSSVVSRRSEFATRAALGARPGRILMELGLEGTTTAVLAVVRLHRFVVQGYTPTIALDASTAWRWPPQAPAAPSSESDQPPRQKIPFHRQLSDLLAVADSRSDASPPASSSDSNARATFSRADASICRSSSREPCGGARVPPPSPAVASQGTFALNAVTVLRSCLLHFLLPFFMSSDFLPLTLVQ